MTSPLEDRYPDILMDEAQIEDENEIEEVVPNLRYDITSYGVDFDVEGLVRRLNRGEILIPEWQRAYVWSHRQASSFVESLLLGLPVPGVFLAQDGTLALPQQFDDLGQCRRPTASRVGLGIIGLDGERLRERVDRTLVVEFG